MIKTKGLFALEMDKQEKILYAGLLIIMKLILETTPKQDFEDLISADTKKEIEELLSLMEQRTDEIRGYNELG